MLWTDPEDVVWAVRTVWVWVPHTRPLGCWLSRLLITDSIREPDPPGPGG